VGGNMRELITIPIVMSLILGVTLQLVEIAESSSQKAVKYAEDMNNAIDCAFKGIDISVCSPDLASTSFKEDLIETKEVVDKLKELNISEINEEEN
jgi:hypothetical protein